MLYQIYMMLIYRLPTVQQILRAACRHSSTFNDADTNTLNAYKAMELYLDD